MSTISRKHKTIFNNLMTLCNDVATQDKFFYSDQVGFAAGGNRIYRIFNYRLASYSVWEKPNAIDARGIMFEIDRAGNPVRLACRGMKKFFNWGENPLVEDLKPENIVSSTVKMDGSLITSFMDGDIVTIKSKGSLHSDVAKAARAYLRTNVALQSFLNIAETHGYNVNMEYTAPDNQIVLSYGEPKLTILNIIDVETGNVIRFDEIDKSLLQSVREYLVDFGYMPESGIDFLQHVRDMVGIEGFVLTFSDGRVVKLKTDWYCGLHKLKDNVNNNKNLVLSVLDESADDLIGLFMNDPRSVEKIKAFMEHVSNVVAEDFNTVLNAYKENHGKDRKHYAVSGQQNPVFAKKPHLFGIYMQLYMDASLVKNLFPIIMERYKKYPELLIPNSYKIEPIGE